MFAKSKLLALCLFALLLVTGCARAVTVETPEVSVVQGAELTASMRYLERLEEGPAYDVSVTLPDEWVGQFETRNVGNTLYFDYVGNGDAPAKLFWIEALSPDQYWKSSGSYPNSHTNIVNRGDTYFVYYLPIDAYYSGLDEDTFSQLSAGVPQVVTSFTATAAR